MQYLVAANRDFTQLVRAWPSLPIAVREALLGIVRRAEMSGALILNGRSFAEVLRGERTEHRDRIFTTHTADGNKNSYPIRSVRSRDWKLLHNLHPEATHTNHSDLNRKPLAGAYWDEWVELAERNERAKAIVERYHHRPEWELYRIADDKWERNNVVDDPQYAEVLRNLKSELTRWREEQGDTAN